MEKKQKRNITGLRYQSSSHASQPENTINNITIKDQAQDDPKTEAGWEPPIQLDSAKTSWEEEDLVEDEEGVDDEMLADKDGDDPRDEDWIPDKQRQKQRKQKIQKSCPSEYKKGPDVGSKTEQTQRRYKKLLSSQQTLENLGFWVSVAPQGMQPSSKPSSLDSESESSSSNAWTPNANIQVCQESATPAPLLFDNEMEVPIWQESLTPPPLAFDDSEHEAQGAWPKQKAGEIDQSDGSDIEEPEGDKAVHKGIANEELWEEELDENLAPNGLANICDWETLQKQIIDNLKKKAKSFSLSQIDQL
ncbi:hypothetical protein B0H34DRAFT_675206 [Crassisporium funariophilum]|nr:hypothetical protein B0H34DRAFT_675206 [Crassisporium funariophilum]